MPTEITRLTLRFDGLDATEHQVDLYSLGEALQGFARIISTAGHFSVTQTYSKSFSMHSVKTYAQEVRANCFSVDMVLNWAQQNQILSGSFGILLAAVIPYIFQRNKAKTEEMKMLKDSLDKAIEALGNRDQAVIERLASTIEKMAEELRPAARLAVSPIGESCKTISIIDTQTKQSIGIINESDKESIMSLSENEITGIQVFDILISELDKVKATCKVNINNAEQRTNAVISDPLFGSTENPYLQAFAQNKAIKVTGKATIKDGEIIKLTIMDIH